MTLRESIALLRSRGLVETRRGRRGGTFVKRQLEPPEQPDRERLSAASVGELRDLSDEHVAIGGAAGRLAAERATPRDVKRIRMFAEQLAEAVTRGARMRLDSRFHIEIAVATRSQRLLRREVALQAESAGMLWLPHLAPGDHDAIVREHQDLAAAIEREDGDAAQSAAVFHIRENLRRLAKGREHG